MCHPERQAHSSIPTTRSDLTHEEQAEKNTYPVSLSMCRALSNGVVDIGSPASVDTCCHSPFPLQPYPNPHEETLPQCCVHHKGDEHSSPLNTCKKIHTLLLQSTCHLALHFCSTDSSLNCTSYLREALISSPCRGVPESARPNTTIIPKLYSKTAYQVPPTLHCTPSLAPYPTCSLFLSLTQYDTNMTGMFIAN